MSSLILGTIGTAIAGPLGGFIGSAIGGAIDAYLFAPTPPDVQGPRAEDLSTTKGDPGTPIAMVYGADRIGGTVIGCTDLIETIHKEKVGSGKKKQTVTSYTYHVDIDLLLCEGPVLGVGRIWADGVLMRGTKQQLDLDTVANYEKIGGIPYEDRYKTHLYNPALVPWSLDPADVGTLSGYYIYDSGTDTFASCTSTEAAAYAAAGRVVYSHDSASGYKIPRPMSHAYTGEAPKEAAPVEIPHNYTDVVGAFDATYNDYLNPETANTSLDLTTHFDQTWLEDSTGAYNRPTVSVQFDYWRSATYYTGGINFTFNYTFKDSGGATVGTDSNSVVKGSIERSETGTATTDPVTVPVGAVTVDIELVKNVGTDYVRLSNSNILSSIKTNSVTETSYSDATTARSFADYYNFYDCINDWSKFGVLRFNGCQSVAFYPGTDDQLSDATMEASLGLSLPGYRNRAHIVLGHLELENFGNRIPNLTFEVVEYDDRRVGDIITDLMDRAGLSGYYDITGVPTTGTASYVLGYTIGSVTSFRAALETLLEAFRLDAAEAGNEIVFRQKVRTYDKTIDYGDLAAVEGDVARDSNLTLTFKDKMEMPRTLTVGFKDPEREYQRNTAMFARQVVPSIQESSKEFPLVLSPVLAKLLARDKMRDLWLERNSAKWTTLHKYVHISPSDIVFINGSAYGKQDFVFKVTQVQRGANGVLSMEGVVRELSLYVPGAGETTNDTRTNLFNLTQAGADDLATTYGYALNLPPLRSSDDDFGFYFAGSGSNTGWQGVDVYRSTDSGASYNLLFQETNASAIGYVYSTPLPAAIGQVVDNDNSVYVQLFDPTQTLSSVTIDQLFQSANAALVGNEIICFANATSLGSGRWKLDVLLRGQLDTDDTYSQTSHVQNERFVLLDESTLVSYADDNTYVGIEELYKFVTFGQSATAYPNTPFTNTARKLKPFRPRMLEGTRDGSNNITLTWVRADRLYGTWPDSSDLPMSENTESYSVDFYDTNGTFLRTVDTTTESASYTAAQQTADGITPGDTVQADVYQISATVGRGNQATEVF